MEVMKEAEQQDIQSEVMDTVYERAKESDAHIALTDTEDPRIEKALQIIEERGLPRPLLITPDYFSNLSPSEQEKVIESLQESRAARGKPLSSDAARKLLLTDTKYVAAAMTRIGLIDGYVAGNTSSTPDAIRPALQVIG